MDTSEVTRGGQSAMGRLGVDVSAAGAAAPSSAAAAALTATIAGLPDLRERQLDADRLLAAEGAGHIVHDLPLRTDGRMVALQSRPWRLDPIPLVIDGDEFVELADGAVARMQMLESILVDLYGARSLLRDAVIDPVALWGSAKYRLAEFGARPVKRWMVNYAVDVARSGDGRWHVLRDLTDAPAGVGYSLLGRAVSARVHRDLIARLPVGGALRSLVPFADRLRDGLADVASTENPRIVVLSGGVDHPSFVEQSYLATRLGLNLVEGADLVVRQRRVWLRSLSGLEPVDVLFRRLEDDRIDPMEVNAEGHVGVPGLLLATRAGGVSLANAHGTGVIDDPDLAEYWDTAGSWLTGRTSNYQGTPPLRLLPVADRATTQWDTTVGFDGNELVERIVALRLHLVASDTGIDVMQGGNGRVLPAGVDPGLPTDATAQDVWVIGGTVAPPALPRRQPLPRVDLIGSVPTRAAEALYWAGRAMERAELVARAMYVVLDRTSGVADAEVTEAWVAPGLDMLSSIAGITDHAQQPAGLDAGHTFAVAVDELARQLGSFLAEASSVREYFSASAGRMMARIADSRTRLHELAPPVPNGAGVAAIDVSLIDARDLESVLVDLSSLVGLWGESVVHGPAWRLGEIGRRLERAFGVIDGVRGAFGFVESADSTTRPWLTAPWSSGTGADDHQVAFQRQRVIELVLATNESLVAYRRRHRSDVEFELAAQLIVADPDNPRSAASAIRAVRHQAERLDWQSGIDVSAALLRTLESASLATVANAVEVLDLVWAACDHLARDVVGAHLVSPVDPRMMGS